MGHYSVCTRCSISIVNDDWTWMDAYHEDDATLTDEYAAMMASVEMMGHAVMNSEPMEYTGYFTCWVCSDDCLGGHVWRDDSAERDARAVILKYVGSDNGEFPSHAWPGCYPIGYIADDGEFLCGECMNREDSVHFTGDSDGWRIDAAMTIEDNEHDETCAHCHKVIAEGFDN
jgi:hypothetical protein